ncbi:MAG: glycosyltransferase family 39 protein [Acidimicrobiales bacterium]
MTSAILSPEIVHPLEGGNDLDDAVTLCPAAGVGCRDPRWAKAALAGLLVATALLYIWGLGASGWANSFYSAAVEASTKSWKAFFFGSFDSSSFITVDKPPASLWVMDLSARLFGLSAWSILVPEALEGVAAVALLYATVKRWFGFRAGLVAGSVLALTPVATLMFRFDNPDSLLVLLLVGGAWATTRAVETGRTRWLLLMAVLVGTGFLTKMMQAFVVVPAFGSAYLLAGPPRFWQRLRQLLAAGVAVAVASGWWVAAVQLTPARDRPYVGGSTDNSELNLIFGYNGFGRLDGNETGSVHGAGAIGSIWGPTGWDRMFTSSFGGQISWLIPAALLLLAGGLWLTRRAPRTDRTRAALLLWGLWLLVTDAVFSFGQGIIHPYYSVALAPAIGAMMGIGAVVMWRHRQQAGRWVMALATATSAVWAYALLDRTPEWLPWLRAAILGAGLLSAAAILVERSLVSAMLPLEAGNPERSVSPLLGAAAGLALAVALTGPAAYSLDTAATAHSGSLPSAGPGGDGSGRPGAPLGQAGALGLRGGPPGLSGRGAGKLPGRGPAGAGGLSGPFGGHPLQGSGLPSGARPGGLGGVGGAGLPGGGGGPGRGGTGSVGGLLTASTPGKALVELLEAAAGRYTWVAAVVGANSAAGYELGTDDPVMAIGGFNGTDPAPSVATFEAYTHEHKIHYYIAGGGPTGPGPAASSTSDASEIGTWVEAHFKSQTVDGTTIYNLAG